MLHTNPIGSTDLPMRDWKPVVLTKPLVLTGLPGPQPWNIGITPRSHLLPFIRTREAEQPAKLRHLHRLDESLRQTLAVALERIAELERQQAERGAA
ncbi:hypothetical protein [Gemmata sp.]|uniref:hypothetical protein n=1 Tax=Gemmata sp. TaxID=1914242 RepID=UPI003F71DD51